MKKKKNNNVFFPNAYFLLSTFFIELTPHIEKGLRGELPPDKCQVWNTSGGLKFLLVVLLYKRCNRDFAYLGNKYI